jgi:tetratricopeptide (TPR) repeat protein
MNRDLVYFVAGLSFGIAAGYFLFRALSPESGARPVASAPATPGSGSTIGLDAPREPSPLDEDEASRLEAKARENRTDAFSRAELGRLYMEAERYEEALPWLEEAVKLRPDDLHVRNHLALTYLNLGRVEGSVAAFEENLRIDSSHAASLLGLGRVKLYLQQDIRGGLALWEKLMEVAPDSPEAKAVRDELEALKAAHAPATANGGS